MGSRSTDFLELHNFVPKRVSRQNDGEGTGASGKKMVSDTSDIN